jgi:hypothetical protein
MVGMFCLATPSRRLAHWASLQVLMLQSFHRQPATSVFSYQLPATSAFDAPAAAGQFVCITICSGHAFYRRSCVGASSDNAAVMMLGVQCGCSYTAVEMMLGLP